jgi:alpha-D-ribose 1-methylphosphonate 5-triphosphate synthase subunit PhnH
METSTIIRDHLTFRVILQAMSHPGKMYPLPEFPGNAPVAVELLGCLMDNETSFAVLGDPDLETALVLHTGSRAVSPETADFILVARGIVGEKTADLRRGSLEYPDSGATIVYLVAGLSEENGDITVSGPGVDGTVSLRIDGLSLNELMRLKEMNNEFPLGVDAVFLDARGRICCIPRSSRIGVN